jgi:hypothetical protein
MNKRGIFNGNFHPQTFIAQRNDKINKAFSMHWQRPDTYSEFRSSYKFIVCANIIPVKSSLLYTRHGYVTKGFCETIKVLDTQKQAYKETEKL